ncbi:glycosyltransferase family 4 protein [Roseinatronobacter alkalisoli]|uniref:Glycosyltransferase family 4 protein n=1 Tax=Roseinatronobacter alkalisoli TaxID=3028235 RepID=A0ABT5TBF8_9RHOB|nr:glycosyltransferase family 4 protein [Roseinatronobacter sp. HJB301]MDD7972336.1 glycosyltransferase family 4 protein [Roseinatronobacter sp. HJB301]
MRIAQVAPLFETVPPGAYGGTERIIATLCNYLVGLGHDVTLFAAAGSVTSARLVESRACGLRDDSAPRVSATAAHLAMLDDVCMQQAKFDVIHCHLSHFLHFPLFADFAAKTLTTPHGRLDYADLPTALGHWPDMPMNSISLSQRRPLLQANWVANIYHGIPVDLYAPAPLNKTDNGPQYLAFMGRFSRDKRADRAIAIAAAAGLPLKLAAKIDEEDRAWFRQEIEPHFDGNRVEYIGEISESEKPQFLGNAAALLFPIDWPEPFGLVVIEAMAHGTPSIVWRNGAMAEIIDEGLSGFVVDSMAQAIATVPLALALDRAKVRQCFERRFDAARMVDEYVATYQDLLRTDRPVSAVL